MGVDWPVVSGRRRLSEEAIFKLRLKGKEETWEQRSEDGEHFKRVYYCQVSEAETKLKVPRN